MPTVDSRIAHRRAAGLIAGAGGLLLVISSFLGWITTPMETGGRTSISGWGLISGGSDEANGVNFNDLMSGVGSYRPGAVAMVAGVVALIPALIIAVTGPGRRPSRVVALLLALCGAVGLVWGLARIIGPGDALGVLPGGQAAAGAGPYVAAFGGLLLLVVGGAVFGGALDPDGMRKDVTPTGSRPRPRR